MDKALQRNESNQLGETPSILQSVQNFRVPQGFEDRAYCGKAQHSFHIYIFSSCEQRAYRNAAALAELWSQPTSIMQKYG